MMEHLQVKSHIKQNSENGIQALGAIHPGDSIIVSAHP